MPYLGNTAASRFVSNRAASVYSGDGSTVAFTLEQVVTQDEDILVSVDGVIQEPSVGYAVSSGTTLTFTVAPSTNSGNNIFVYYLASQAGTVGHPSTQALSATNGTFSGTLTVAGATTLTTKLATTNLATGAVVQVVNVQTGAVATGTTVIPADDTIPQKTEGDQFMTLAITPTSSSNKLKIDVVASIGNNSANSSNTVALFQDSTANAIAVALNMESGAEFVGNTKFTHYMTSGTTSATTFKVRAGSNQSATTTFNGRDSGRFFGGVFASSITITEIAV